MAKASFDIREKSTELRAGRDVLFLRVESRGNYEKKSNEKTEGEKRGYHYDKTQNTT